MRRTLALLGLATPLAAQEALTLRQAVDLALRSNPLVAGADAGEKEAEARIHLQHQTKHDSERPAHRSRPLIFPPLRIDQA